jgi:hypothetical protein
VSDVLGDPAPPDARVPAYLALAAAGFSGAAVLGGLLAAVLVR